MVRYDDHTDKVKGNLKTKQAIFMREMLDKIHDIAKPMTPKKDGNLKNDVLKQVLGTHGKMTWNKDYASYQERGARRDGTRQVRKYTTGGTGRGFAQKAVMEGIKDTDIIATRSGIA